MSRKSIAISIFILSALSLCTNANDASFDGVWVSQFSEGVSIISITGKSYRQYFYSIDGKKYAGEKMDVIEIGDNVVRLKDFLVHFSNMKKPIVDFGKPTLVKVFGLTARSVDGEVKLIAHADHPEYDYVRIK